MGSVVFTAGLPNPLQHVWGGANDDLRMKG